MENIGFIVLLCLFVLYRKHAYNILTCAFRPFERLCLFTLEMFIQEQKYYVQMPLGVSYTVCNSAINGKTVGVFNQFFYILFLGIFFKSQVY